MSQGVMLLSVQHDMEANSNASTLCCDAAFLVPVYPNVTQMNSLKNGDITL